MTIRNRLPPWHEVLHLRNGREVLIRPIRPDDAPPLQAGFSLLEPDEIRQRFLYTMKELTESMAQRLTQLDTRREFALVVAEPLPPGDALIGGVARAAMIDHTRDAEFAILVSRYIAGMGLGRHLMQRLVRWAKGKKLENLCGDVLEQNHTMLALADSLGFERVPSKVPGLTRVRLNLREAVMRRSPTAA